MGQRQEDQKLAQLSCPRGRRVLGAQIRVTQVVMGEHGQLTKKTKKQKDLMFPTSSKEKNEVTTCCDDGFTKGVDFCARFLH